MQRLGVFRPRLFGRSAAAFAAVLALCALLADRVVVARMQSALVETLAGQMSASARLATPYARELVLAPAAGALEEVRALGAGLRITLVAPDGRVLVDSHQDASRMENHGSRPEIRRALAEESGEERRASRTLGEPLLYVARRLDGRDGRALGVLRLSAPLAGVEAAVASARRRLVACTAAALAVGIACAALLARRAGAPIVALTRVANAIRAGVSDAPLAELPRDGVVGELAETLRALGAEVTQRIATISQEDAQLRAMLAGMVEGVVAVDDEDRVLFRNEAARRLLRLDGEPRARRLWEQAPNAALEELIQSARTGGGPVHSELELHRRGKEVVLQAQASPFRGGGRSGVVVVVHDVTDLRRLERIRRDFVANVSHELKTPLAAIKGFVETLLGGALRDEAHNVRFLERIDANVDRLTNLVTDLLSLARVESREGAVERVPVDWREVVEGAHKRWHEAAERKGLVLSIDGARARVVVLGDREAMTQVLDNLVDNAIKYTASGRVEIALAVEGGAGQAGEGVLVVRDTGLGIPAAELERVFERFYRVDKARSRALGGTGLGLSIVKHLALSMGGRVSVESEVGRGSSFVVRLRLAG